MRKAFEIISAIIRYLLWIIIIFVLAIVLVQRISNNQKSLAGIRIFTVVTESMVPEYNVGDTIIVKSIEPSKLKVGDDITYLGEKGSFSGKYITHRIINISQDETGMYKLRTQGIANPEPDPAINETQVYGKIIYKTLLISKLNGLVGNLYSMYFIILVPISIMIFFEIRAFRRKDDEDEDKNSDSCEDELKEKKLKHNRNRRERRRQRRDKRRRNKKE